MNNVDGPDDKRGFFDHAKAKSQRDLEKYIRETLAEKRPDLTKDDCDKVVSLIVNLKFMQSPEAIEAFIKNASKELK